MRGTGMVFVALAALGCGGNTVGTPDGSQCEGCSDPQWTCLGQPVARSEPGPRLVTVHLQHLVASRGPVVGAVVKVCRKIDVSCDEGQPAEGLITDADGNVTLELASGETENLQIVKNEPGLPPSQQLLTTYFYDFRPPGDRTATVSVQMATVELHDQLMSVLSAAPQPDRALVLLNAKTCQGAAAANVTFRADPAAEPFYAVGGIPNSETIGTDESGFGGFANMTAGAVTITGELAKTGTPMGSISVLVRPNSLVQASLVPSTD
jgi:hypothetical protein